MLKTVAEHLAEDPKVQMGKKLLLEALEHHQKSVTGVRGPLPGRELAYSDLVKQFGELRGGALFFPYLGSGMGKGALVELADGSVKYDFISGIGVHHWGHSHPRIAEALLHAALKDTVQQGNLQQNVESATLARDLVAGANRRGAALKHCFFSTSGAMANENALKIVLQKKYPADRILAFEGCFMGRTLTLSQITDKPEYREGLPETIHVDYIPFFDPEDPTGSIQRSLAALKRHIRRYPGKHAVMAFELIQGEGGFNAGARDFFVPLMEELKNHDIPVLVDEVQTFGRTSELFAFQHFSLDRYVDVVTLGKAALVCATLFTEELKPRAGLLSQTFTAGTGAILASQVVIRNLLEGGYFGPRGKIVRIHEHVVRRLEEIRHRRPGLITGIHGIGAMIAFTPFGGEPERVKKLIHALFDAGVICFYAGAEVLRVRFLLPVGAVSFEDIDAGMAIMEEVLVDLTD